MSKSFYFSALFLCLLAFPAGLSGAQTAIDNESAAPAETNAAAETTETESTETQGLIEESPKVAEDVDPVKTPEEIEKDKLLSKISGVIATHGKKEGQHFFSMYTAYALVSMVKTVEADIGNAVQACSDKNKDMEERLQSRFEAWKKSVKKPSDEVMASIDNMILAQDYMPAEEIREVFALVDSTRKIGESRFAKVPVSTPEACEFMLSKMDETQETMIGLLEASVRSFNKVLQKTQE